MKERDSSFRARLYQHYLSVGSVTALPRSTADLRPRQPYLDQFIRRFFPREREARILELGCGHGALLHCAASAGYTAMEGVDGSPEQVACARRLGISGVRQREVLDELRDREDGSLDGVVAFDLLEHLTKDEALSLVDESCRVLAATGRLILHTVNGASPFFGRIRYGDLTHEQAFTAASLTQLLRAGGFRDVSVFEDRPVVHGIPSLLRAVVWSSFRAGLRLALAAETGNWRDREILTQNFVVIARPAA